MTANPPRVQNQPGQNLTNAMNPDKKRASKLNPRQLKFAALVATGSSQADAYRKAYGHGRNRQKDQLMSELSSRLAAKPGVKAEIERIRGRAEVKHLLTLNQRLELLAEMAQAKGKTPAFINAKTRAIDVYSKISGDQAPERHEVTGAGGGPIPVAATAAISVTRVPIRRRMELMREARRLAAEKEAKP